MKRLIKLVINIALNVMNNSYSLNYKRKMQPVVQYYYDKKKNDVTKFSADNNMDLGEVSGELQDLTKIKEMLIMWIFPIISVYCLHKGQYAYCKYH